MAKRIISEGNKLELQKLQPLGRTVREDDEDAKTYYSLVSEVIEEDKFKITMPLEKGRVIPLPINGRFNASFYTDNGVYQARLIVLDRYKEDNIYMLIVQLTSDLVKFQRRQYYRLGCTMDIRYKIKEDDDEEFETDSDIQKEMLAGYKTGIARDISGGGMRFISEEQIQPDSEIFLVLEIQYAKEIRKYGLNANVISSVPMPKRRDRFENRIEYKNIDGRVRESLIKYIFDEERRQRKKEFDDK